MKKKFAIVLLSLLTIFNIFSEESLDAFLNKFKSENWIINWYIDVLYSENRETVKKFTQVYQEYNYSDIDGDVIFPWYDEQIFKIEHIKTYERNLKTGYKDICIGYDHYFIINKFLITSKLAYKLKGIEYDTNKQADNWSSIDWTPVRNFDEFDLIFVFDGDYVSIYLNQEEASHLFCTFCRVDDTTLEQFESLIRTNTCDLSKVTWPRHVDGTCDYDGAGKPAVKTSVQLSAGITKLVSTNLRLRSTQDTSSTVIATMQKGTTVKIIKTGSKDTIDGITSNWVQVEVEAGAKDRNGKSITAGTTGWCFGGYLE